MDVDDVLALTGKRYLDSHRRVKGEWLIFPGRYSRWGRRRQSGRGFHNSFEHLGGDVLHGGGVLL